MKKFLLTLLVVFTGIVNANAEDYIAGSWDGWTTHQFSYSGSDGTLTLNLSAGTYSFKFVNGGTWMGNDGTMDFTNCSSWEFSNNGGNCTLKAAIAGDYTFTVKWSGSTPSLSVTFPPFDDAVYFCNTLNWGQPYAYILSSSYWSATSGSGCQNQPRAIKMTQIGSSNIWKAEFPSGARSEYVAFTESDQSNYEHFYQTNAVYKTDQNSSTPLFVPTTTVTTTLNEVNYYNDGEWHAYPTYTRNVTPDNFGTICLPFNATITGATAYKIVNTIGSGDAMTGLNLESVNELEAGKAYIFKATGSTLTASYSDSYADATDANGMLGNLSSTAITLDGSTTCYVVNNNVVKKVVSGGTGVNVSQYRAYITLTGIQSTNARGANFIGFDNDETTGIDNIQAENGQNAVYNLQGQRVMNAQKGVFIVNGKKMLIK